MVRRITFRKAVGDVLAEAGFEASRKSAWVRDCDGYVDEVDLQIASSLDQITVNIHVLDSQVRSDIQRARPANPFVATLSPVHERLPMIMTGYDRWWRRSDPDGPRQVAEAVRDHGLPFLHGLHSPEAMLAYLQARGSIKWRDPKARMNVALILHRLGRTEEALLALSDPPRRLDGGEWLATVEALRRYVASTPDTKAKLP